MAETSVPFTPCIIVHGGAGNIPISRRDQVLCAIREAVKIGYRVLLEVRFTWFCPEAVAFVNLHSSKIIVFSFKRCLSLVFMCDLDFILGS